MKAVIDTNIIIDALANRVPFNIDAQRVLLEASSGSFDAVITSNTVTDIYYLLHKAFPDSGKVKKILGQLFSSISIISVEEADCRKALTSKITDYEDAILSESALRNCADYIITRNIKDFNNSKTKAILPADFIKGTSKNFSF
jgi:predicted nucleic acid-binding protein